MAIGDEVENNETANGEELDLSETDSLPWLEADEDDDEAGGFDTAQIVGFIAILAALLLGVVGAIYLISNRGGDETIVADGSTIEAPAGPIKERPEDPGGKEFAGTGNVAPAVGEGQTREGQIGSDDGSQESSETITAGAASTGDEGASGSAAARTTGTGNASTGSSGGVGVQLAAYSSRARAEQGWSQLSRQTDALSGVRYRVVEGQIDSGTVFRLQAVADDRASADALCRALKADGLDCAVKP